jgi:hypothetical protein
MLIAALALAATQPVAEPPAQNEITVIANKLRDWRGNWRMRKGALSCKTTRSTGDKAVDALGCDAMVACIAPIAPQIDAIDVKKVGKEAAQQQVNGLFEATKVYDCMFARREAGIAALAAARRSKRS